MNISVSERTLNRIQWASCVELVVLTILLQLLAMAYLWDGFEAIVWADYGLVLAGMFIILALHEYIHIWQARREGLEPKVEPFYVVIKVKLGGRYDSLSLDEFTPEMRRKYDRIARAPYYVIFPLCLALMGAGWFTSEVAFTLGVTMLLAHIFNYFGEWVVK